MRNVNIITVILIATQADSSKDFSSLIDVDSLSELPIEALLNIQKNIQNVADNNETDHDTVTETFSPEERINPQALPFYKNEKIKDKGDGYYVQYVEEDKKYEKKKSVSKIFQSSVTVLAFLAFGGYLLFLIIAAIKGKQYYNPIVYDPNTTQIMQAMINAQMNRKKKKRKKPIRGHGQIGYKTEEYLDNSRVRRDMLNTDINIEEMYQVLVNLCEGYHRIAGYK
ncbi:unnamed protein product [Ceutorhynchus assimilis]|uniref:Uncharacterized protein n=1 Tax=Ceutorhynchus assimilis TaxID=467358 RepID=A0A9N9MKK4_9CUCU|nr:unnamed protein product [Ceutorhynchus assimilis]